MRIGGEWFDCVTEETVADRVISALAAGRGGRIITPNVDILRLAAGHSRIAAEVRGFFADASLVVADGMPLVWASRIAGTPLPERVTGSGLIWTVSAALGRARRCAYVLGGKPVPLPRGDLAHGPDGSELAAAALASSCPGLEIAGHHAPAFGFDRDPATYAEVISEVADAKPDFVFVGLGFPRQERVISDLRAELPETWFLGCGAAVGFVAGQTRRAPFWMQRSGLEWAHRLAQEPGRLAGRYLAHDAPYAMKLLATAAARRL
ncbi:acetyl-mannosamine transferase [Rhizocola hellebori]|uniref:Acetyl-mannosamine transferase n=1 Tax=Rhizocola hellebori TaxID=1392758 RepID=A0A8J3Q605_9ACTN|nr:acetyl-mannosamine transferase [Rhizocola hellebori]